jgi:hypothetical protein
MRLLKSFYEWLNDTDHSQIDSIMLALGFLTGGCFLILMCFALGAYQQLLQPGPSAAPAVATQTREAQPTVYYQNVPDWRTNYNDAYVKSRFGSPRSTAETPAVGFDFPSGKVEAAAAN